MLFHLLKKVKFLKIMLKTAPLPSIGLFEIILYVCPQSLFPVYSTGGQPIIYDDPFLIIQS
jgi:hypothetical protein